MRPEHMMSFPEEYPELLEQIGQVIYNRLVNHDMASGQATSLTFEITEAIRTEIGGVQQYIPRGLSYELSQRDQKIWNEFNGSNYQALAHKYNLTEMQVRNIVKRARQREMAARQFSCCQAETKALCRRIRGPSPSWRHEKFSIPRRPLPPVRARAQAFPMRKQEGIDILVTSTYRDLESQAALYAQGRTAPGKRVTNAKPGQSYHNWRVAFDVVPLRDGKAVWNTTGADGKLWERIGQLGEAVGLEWAGRWKTFREYAHFQYTGGLSLAQLAAGKTPSPEVVSA